MADSFEEHASSPPDMPTPSRRWRLRRLRRRFWVVPLVLFVIFCAVTARFFILPATGRPSQVDAIVVPGGEGGRVHAAEQLAAKGFARYLVLSQGMYVPPHLCGAHIGKTLVICFRPDPDSTQGEAEATAMLAQEYHWHSIVLLATPDQLWRAELRFRRCFNGNVYGVTTPLPIHLWPSMIVYQWVATAKAELVNRSC
jgi:uncharacterized SAM-binding protein YcdF (DUF218 family)